MTAPVERRDHVDPETGARVIQWTAFPAIHHHPFFYVPPASADGRRIVFISHRTGCPEVFTVDRTTGAIQQHTEREGIGEWSLHPGWESPFVLYVAGKEGWRLDLDTGRETQVADFGMADSMRGAGMVGAGIGVTALSRCDRWWAVRVNLPGEHGLVITDLRDGTSDLILRRDEIAHMSFCPDDASLLFAARTLQDRMWVVRRDGSEHRRLVQRARGEWLTHESWIPGTGELAFVNWPNGVEAVDPRTMVRRRVVSANAWHAICNRAGTRMVADTNLPDRGLQVFDPRGGGAPVTVCHPRASNMGAHWGGPFPYEDGPIEVYAPQHTHPHPAFTPDGLHIVFTSDCTGHSQIYEVEAPR